MRPAEFLTIARLKKTQGRHGEIAAEILTDFPERFSERKRVFLLAKLGERLPMNLENHWFHKGCVVLKFSGIDSISDAEALLAQGQEIQIPASEAVALEPDTFFVHDLIGCSLFDVTSGREAGTIDNVVPGAGSAQLLIVTAPGPKGVEHMIPFAAEYVEQIDTANKRVRMKLPAGLLEVNQPNYDDAVLPDERGVRAPRKSKSAGREFRGPNPRKELKPKPRP